VLPSELNRVYATDRGVMTEMDRPARRLSGYKKGLIVGSGQPHFPPEMKY